MCFDESFLFGEFDDRLPLRLDSVMRRWRIMLAQQAPWSAMHADDAFGMMSRILRELLNESLEVNRRAQDLRVVTAAHAHGAFRRLQRCRLESITCEFDLLLAALVDELKERGLGGRTLGDAMVSLNAELRLAETAAMTGWRREKLSDDADAKR